MIYDLSNGATVSDLDLSWHHGHHNALFIIDEWRHLAITHEHMLIGYFAMFLNNVVWSIERRKMTAVASLTYHLCLDYS